MKDCDGRIDVRILQVLVDSGVSVRDISAQLKVARSTVSDAIKRHGLRPDMGQPVEVFDQETEPAPTRYLSTFPTKTELEAMYLLLRPSWTLMRHPSISQMYSAARSKIPDWALRASMNDRIPFALKARPGAGAQDFPDLPHGVKPVDPKR